MNRSTITKREFGSGAEEMAVGQEDLRKVRAGSLLFREMTSYKDLLRLLFREGLGTTFPRRGLAEGGVAKTRYGHSDATYCNLTRGNYVHYSC